MSEKNHKILNMIDNIKQKLTDQEYKEIVEALGTEEKKADQYLVSGFYTCFDDMVNSDGSLTKTVKLNKVQTPLVVELSDEIYENIKTVLENDSVYSMGNHIDDFEDFCQISSTTDGCDCCDETIKTMIRSGTFYATKIKPLK